jgi:hypothetical protein
VPPPVNRDHVTAGLKFPVPVTVATSVELPPEATVWGLAVMETDVTEPVPPVPETVTLTTADFDGS